MLPGRERGHPPRRLPHAFPQKKRGADLSFDDECCGDSVLTVSFSSPRLVPGPRSSPTYAATATGSPHVASVPLPHPVHHHEHEHHPRHEQPPKWVSHLSTNGLLKTAVNAAPTRNRLGQRFLSTSTKSVAPKVPDFDDVRVKDPQANQTLSYFVIGSLGVLSAAGGKATVHDFLTTLSASADVLAMAKVEVDLNAIPLGKNAVIKWRGKPVFVRHRTEDEIQEADSVDVASLRDPEADKQRAQRPEWLVMLGVCTHLGCVPIGEAGDYGGWFCPCHGSHYDISGRIRKGPAPLNLEVPEYSFNDAEGKLVIG